MTPNNTKTRSKTGSVIMTVIAIGVVLAAGIYFFRFFSRERRFETTNDAQVEAYINPISARAAGYIARINFEENQLVKAGDTLVILDPREYANKVEEAEAALEDSRAQLTVLNASIAASEVATSVNRDQINAAQARLTQQEQDIHRYDHLLEEEAATRQEYEVVKARYDVAGSEFNAARNTLKTSISRIDELKSRKALLEADLKRKTVQLDLARINLGYTVITAPYTGRLGRKTIQVGQQIQAGQPLVAIVNEQQKWVTANFKETQLGDMYVGKPVTIELDAMPGKTFEGRIVSVSEATGAKFSLLPPDNATGNFVKIVQRVPVKIEFTGGALDRVKAGMSAMVAVKKS